MGMDVPGSVCVCCGGMDVSACVSEPARVGDNVEGGTFQPRLLAAC